MTAVDYTPEALEAAARTLAGKGPVHMVNLVRYRAQADYSEQTRFPPCSGRDAYFQRYVPAFAKVAETVGSSAFTVFLLGSVQATLVAPVGEAWDDIAIVEYPSFEALRRILDDPRYEAEAAPHRRAALEDWRFIATLKADLPG